MAGYCLVTANIKKSPLIGVGNIEKKEAALWHIYVSEEHRRHGYAKTILDALKISFDTIFTQALTPEGKKMLMANGFVREDGSGVPTWRWTKKQPDV